MVFVIHKCMVRLLNIDFFIILGERLLHTQMYGKARMEMKVGLTFACMNLKKLAMMLQKSGRKGCLISTFLSFWANDCCKQRKMVLGQQS